MTEWWNTGLEAFSEEYCFRRFNLASTKPNSNRDPRAGQVDRDTWQDKQFILCKKCWKCDLGAPKAT
uniref:HDC04686 n=1 Tax=Drosophila melanogaster TaxID=7227 RepID=Q6IGW8_DROME|nr:TPA_inf: HDC04686 [Drosophila melanogaster]